MKIEKMMIEMVMEMMMEMMMEMLDRDDACMRFVKRRVSELFVI
jgi:hypothetical protein